MANELLTRFIFDDKDDAKIDALNTKLVNLDTKLNSLGQNPTFGQGLAADLTKGTDAVSKLAGGVDSLKTKVENFGLPPTISRYLENEERLVKSASERIAASIDTAKASINQSTRPELFPNKSNPLQSKEFGKPDNALFESVKKSRLEIQKLNSERIDAGKFDGLTKAGIRLHDQLGKTQADILRINNALKQTNNKTLIDELNNDLVQAQNNFDKLSSRQQQYEKRQSGGKVGARSGGGRRGGITDLQATVLELTDDFAPEGFNRPFNAAAKGMLAVNAVSMTTLATFGAIAAVGYGIVKITENIREEAERRLKVENAISAAVNNQILSTKQALKDFEELRKQADFDRRFSASVQTNTQEELKNKRAGLEQLLKLTPANLPTVEDGKLVSKPNENFERLKNQIIAVNAQLDALQQKSVKTSNDSFNQRWDSWKKSQEDAIKAQEKFNKSVEDGKKKVEELGKTYNSAFDNLFSKTNSDNPFVRVFSEGEKALKSLRENLKGLDADLQSKAIAMQQKLKSNALFETRIDNNLSIFDLRERARNFRNPQESPETIRKRIDDVARRSAETGGFFPNFGGSFGSFLANQAGGFDKLTDNQKRDIYETRMFGNLGFIGNSPDSSFNNLNQNSLQTALANDRLRESDNDLTLNDRLKKQIDIINSGISNVEERAIADRKLLSLTSGLNPNEINSDLRNKIAAAAESEAERRANFERDSLQIEKEKLAVQKEIDANGKRLLAIAEKEGLQGLNKAIEVIITNKSGGAADVKKEEDTGKSAGQEDVRNYYDLGFVGGAKGGSNR
jgi:hypothetical protein